MIWVAIAIALVLWLTGAALEWGSWVNLLLLGAAVLLAYQALAGRRGGARDR